MKTNPDETAQLALAALLAEYRDAIEHLGVMRTLDLISQRACTRKKVRKARDKVFDLSSRVWDATGKKPPMTIEELDRGDWLDSRLSGGNSNV